MKATKNYGRKAIRQPNVTKTLKNMTMRHKMYAIFDLYVVLHKCQYLTSIDKN